MMFVELHDDSSLQLVLEQFTEQDELGKRYSEYVLEVTIFVWTWQMESFGLAASITIEREGRASYTSPHLDM